jgi:hypothetical protein
MQHHVPPSVTWIPPYSPSKLTLDEASARERALRIRRLWVEAKAQGHQTWPKALDELAAAVAKGAWTQVFNLAGLATIAAIPLPHRADLEATAQAVAPILKEEEAGTLPTETTGTGLYRALDRFAEHIEKTKLDAETGQTTPWGKTLADQVRRTKSALPDMALQHLKEAEIAKVVAYWKARPCRKGTSKRIDSTTAITQIKALKYFLKWLPKNTGWRRCEYDDLLSVRKTDLAFKSEIADLANGIPMWTVAELATIYKYATPYERVFILLGMNCGFAQAEIYGLRKTEIHLDADPPHIARIRQKKKVFGKSALWAETQDALEWIVKPGNHLWAILSDNNHQLTHVRIANTWNRLISRIRKDIPDFRFLSFKYLRKTAMQMVQDFSDYYHANVFAFHGRAAQDGQLSAYTNADFQAVFDAQAKVRKALQPVFDGVEPFTGKLQGGANISRGTIERIREMALAGIGKVEIARALEISRSTVYRWLPKSE